MVLVCDGSADELDGHYFGYALYLIMSAKRKLSARR
jgi:hypothetical protein